VPSERSAIGVIGAGSFGTALANVLASGGHDVTLWVHEPKQAEDIRVHRENRRYHPGFRLEDRLRPTCDLAEAVANKPLVLAVSPSHVTRAILSQAAPFLSPETIVVCASKGIEIDTLELMCQVLDEVLPEPNRARAAYLSGPSFAKEVMQRLPTAVTVAAADPQVREQVQKAFNTDYFRVYTVDDVIGVEIAGAVKNVMAIAAGIADGLGYGYNTRAAIISRGLAEISRLGAKMGAKPMTFLGLAGVGDLVLTCTGDLSRNRTVGLKLGSGQTLEQILAGSNQVAEGINTTKAVHFLSRKLEVDMPIVEAVYQILYEQRSAAEAVGRLMGRPLKRESA